MDVNELFSYMIGIKVLACEVGENVDSICCLDFAENMSLVIFSAWRIEHNGQIIVTDQDATKIGKVRVLSYIRRVVGKKVLSFNLSKQYDLVLHFEDSYCIRTFSNISYSQTENGGDWDANWKLGIFDKNIIGCATNHFEMKFEKLHNALL